MLEGQLPPDLGRSVSTAEGDAARIGRPRAEQTLVPFGVRVPSDLLETFYTASNRTKIPVGEFVREAMAAYAPRLVRRRR